MTLVNSDYRSRDGPLLLERVGASIEAPGE